MHDQDGSQYLAWHCYCWHIGQYRHIAAMNTKKLHLYTVNMILTKAVIRNIHC